MKKPVAMMTTGKEQRLSKDFVNYIKNEDYSAAYDMFHEGLQKVMSKDSLAYRSESLEMSSDCKLKITGVSSKVSTEQSRKSVKGKITCPDDKSYTFKASFVGEGKIISFSIKPRL